MIKYLRMFKMFDLSIESKSTEKSHIFPLKDTSFKSSLLHSSDALPIQNQEEKLLFLLLALNL